MTAPTVEPLELSGEFTIKQYGETRTAPGLEVLPGLAITPAFGRHGDPIPRRYTITHIQSGLSVPVGWQCATHLREAIAALGELGVDWTQDPKVLLGDGWPKDRISELVTGLRNTCLSDWTDCPGDPTPWQVRCNTCDWEFDPEDGDTFDAPPTTAEEARQVAGSHECDPWMEIKPPDSDKWGPPHSFVDDPDEEVA